MGWALRSNLVEGFQVQSSSAAIMFNSNPGQVADVRAAAASGLLELAKAEQRQACGSQGQQPRQPQEGETSLLDAEHISGVAACLSDPMAAVRGAARQILQLSLKTEAGGLDVAVQVNDS
jgi:hypothetical protein